MFLNRRLCRRFREASLPLLEVLVSVSACGPRSGILFRSAVQVLGAFAPSRREMSLSNERHRRLDCWYLSAEYRCVLPGVGRWLLTGVRCLGLL